MHEAFASPPARSVDSRAELTSRSTAAGALALLLLVGCAGWKGNTYYAHRAPAKRARKEATYRFGEPGPAWQPVRNLEEVQVAWVRSDLGGLIELHAQCQGQGDSSLDQYTDHIRIDWTDWETESQEQTRLVDRAALRTVATGRLDGVLRRNELWVVKKNGCLFDLRYSANPAHFEAGQPDFAQVVAGFRFPVRG